MFFDTGLKLCFVMWTTLFYNGGSDFNVDYLQKKGGGMLVGFARVSAVHQDLDNQVNALKKYGCEKIFDGKNSGKAESNKKRMAELLEFVRDGDVVVVTKLDRLGRSLSQVLATLECLKNKKVGFIAIEQGIDTTAKQDPLSLAMIQLLGVFAELERSMIVDRTISGKKAKGKLQGRPESLSAEQYSDFQNDVSKGLSLTNLAKKYNMGRATVVRWKKKLLGGVS